jgi:hypothetical protein
VAEMSWHSSTASIYCKACRIPIFDYDYVVIVRKDPTASTGGVEYYHLKCWERYVGKYVRSE